MISIMHAPALRCFLRVIARAVSAVKEVLLRKKSKGFILRLRRAMSFVRPHRTAVVFIITLTFGLAGLNALEPLVFKYVFDALEEGGAVRILLLGVLALIGTGLIRETAGLKSNWLTWRTRLKVHQTLLGRIVERLQSLPVSYHQAESVGSIMTRVDRGIQGFLGAVSEIAFNVLPALLYLGISVVVMVRLDWRLSLVVIAFTPIPAIISALATPERIRREKTLMDRWARIYSRFNEVLAGIVTVKSFAMEKEEKHRFMRDVESANNIVVKGVGTDGFVGAGQNLVVVFAKVAWIAFGGLLVLRGEITLGTAIAFLGYVGGLFGPVQGLCGIYKTLRTASVSLDIIFSILDSEDHLKDDPDAGEVSDLRGEVVFEKVSFSYTDRNPVLDCVDLKVEPGETVAIVGPSGAGKSTMLSLLLRLHDPTEGRVMIDGKDIRGVKQQSLRRKIGVVQQEPLLFNDSLRNNIAYGRPDAGLDEICEAAELANVHQFAYRLPEGWESCLGERGCRLSAGERQRVAIARALLKNPPLLVLDEATSALDAETEHLVQEALDRLKQGRTTFIVAHRLSTVTSANRILVLKDGDIREQGSHTELMALGGYYAYLVDRQTRGFLAPERESVSV
jgi:ATP-binding cassette subfamily B protein